MNKEELKAKIRGCTACPLSANRILGVPGHANNDNVEVAVFSEAPGEDESQFGIPFVGRTGQYLRETMEKVGFRKVLFSYMVHCISYGSPPPEALAGCEQWVEEEINVYRPTLVILMGSSAIQWKFGKGRVGALRGKYQHDGNVVYIATYNPAAVLRNPQYEEAFTSDLGLAKQLLDEFNR